MREKLKAFGAWVYHWVTVITALASGGVAMLFQLLDMLGIVDWTAFFQPQLALQITTGIAIAKALHAFYLSQRSA